MSALSEFDTKNINPSVVLFPFMTSWQYKQMAFRFILARKIKKIYIYIYMYVIDYRWIDAKMDLPIPLVSKWVQTSPVLHFF